MENTLATSQSTLAASENNLATRQNPIPTIKRPYLFNHIEVTNQHTLQPPSNGQVIYQLTVQSVKT